MRQTLGAGQAAAAGTPASVGRPAEHVAAVLPELGEERLRAGLARLASAAW